MPRFDNPRNTQKKHRKTYHRNIKTNRRGEKLENRNWKKQSIHFWYSQNTSKIWISDLLSHEFLMSMQYKLMNLTFILALKDGRCTQHHMHQYTNTSAERDCEDGQRLFFYYLFILFLLLVFIQIPVTLSCMYLCQSWQFDSSPASWPLWTIWKGTFSLLSS